MNDSDCPFEVGDVLRNTSNSALAQKVRVTKTTSDYFRADVMEGVDTSQPITVFRAGWFLYAKENKP